MTDASSRYRLRLSSDVVAFIRDLHPEIKKKIRGGLATLCRDATAGKPLKLELEGLRSFRVGKFRIVYRLAEHGVLDVVTL
jgi:mRNA interferase RelE/StbE